MMFIPTRMKPAFELQELLGGAFYNIFKYQSVWLTKLVGMEEFDENKELGHIAKWVTIIVGITTLLKFLGFDVPSSILVALLVFVFVQSNIKDKSSKHYKQQAEKFEKMYMELKDKNGKKK